MNEILDYPISPFLKLKMLNKEDKIIGIVKNKIQVIIGLPNINDFSNELQNTIKEFSKSTECFIITSSGQELTNKIIEEYKLSKALISFDFDNFSTMFNLKNKEDHNKNSLTIINENCQIVHRDII